ncbi:hypothetical protein [Nonlabens sp. Asnod3-A02]|uniref:hypothetical protein n=1 Tax=Nonlabens sp. Asnod3-A02 TaxID=3160579 RepID=UPI00386B01CC
MITRRYFFLMMLLPFFYSCHSSSDFIDINNLCGKYELAVINKSHHRQYKSKLHTNSRVSSGLKMELLKDSTFLYSTCGLNAEGTWQVRDSVLLLQPLTHHIKSKPKNISEEDYIHSFNVKGFLKFQIEKEHLIGAIKKTDSVGKSLVVFQKQNNINQ